MDKSTAQLNKMILARNYLKQECPTVLNDKFDEEYMNILDQICSFVKKHCQHEYIDDYIDLDCERGGMYISYCRFCEDCLNADTRRRAN